MPLRLTLLRRLMKKETDFNYKTLEEIDMDEWSSIPPETQSFLIDLFKKNILFHNGEIAATLYAQYVKKSCQLGVDIDLIPGEIMKQVKREYDLEYIENNIATETY